MLFGLLFLGFFLIDVVPRDLAALSEDGSRFHLNSWPLLVEISGRPWGPAAVSSSVVVCLALFTVGRMYLRLDQA